MRAAGGAGARISARAARCVAHPAGGAAGERAAASAAVVRVYIEERGRAEVVRRVNDVAAVDGAAVARVRVPAEGARVVRALREPARTRGEEG